ncbi:MAG: hypothetical protein ACEPO8_12435 [Rhodothermaceae bacterium]
MKKPKHRSFDYEPRFYDPAKDEVEKKKNRLSFRSSRMRKKGKSNVFLIALILLVLYFMINYGGF